MPARIWSGRCGKRGRLMRKKDINMLDGIWAHVVKLLAGYRCEHCSIQGVRMEAAHVVGRRHRTTRWGTQDDLCGHCFCHSCHQNYDEHGPLENDIIIGTIGVERKEDLQFLARTSIAKYQDPVDIAKRLYAELDKGENINYISEDQRIWLDKHRPEVEDGV